MFLFLQVLRVSLALRNFSLGRVADGYRPRAEDSQQKRLSEPFLAFGGGEMGRLGFVAQEATLDQRGATGRADQDGEVLRMDAAIGRGVQFIERLLHDLGDKHARGALCEIGGRKAGDTRIGGTVEMDAEQKGEPSFPDSLFRLRPLLPLLHLLCEFAMSFRVSSQPEPRLPPWRAASGR